LVRRTLGPSGGYFIRDMVVGKVRTLLGYTIDRAEIRDAKVHLRLRAHDGSVKEIMTDHVISATGYKVDLERLRLLSPELRLQIRTAGRAPVLSRGFESSVPGLYFVGIAAANSFGPVMRFAFGAGFAARRITEALEKSLALHPSRVPAVQLAPKAE
jgi:thioredoxin reductase